MDQQTGIPICRDVIAPLKISNVSCLEIAMRGSCIVCKLWFVQVAAFGICGDWDLPCARVLVSGSAVWGGVRFCRFMVWAGCSVGGLRFGWVAAWVNGGVWEIWCGEIAV